jgi:hypothetical protein
MCWFTGDGTRERGCRYSGVSHRRFNPRGAGPGHYKPAVGHGTTKRGEIPHHQLLSVSVFEIVNIAFRKLGVGTADAIFQIS